MVRMFVRSTAEQKVAQSAADWGGPSVAATVGRRVERMAEWTVAWTANSWADQTAGQTVDWRAKRTVLE